MKILVTGGLGFIGSAFVRHILQRYPSYQIIVLDALTYAGNLDNLPEWVWDSTQFFFWQGSICDPRTVELLVAQVDVVVHCAAETHVDNSIYDYNTGDFIDTDVKGTQVLLDAVRHNAVRRFVHISTSEVYGTALYEPMDENHPLNPRSPYAAAKVGADRLVYCYVCTFDLPAVILRPFNNFGPHQHIEKLIPMVVTNILQGKPFPLHGDGSSARDWVFVDDTVEGMDRAIHADLNKIRGEVINIGTGVATDILTIAKQILRLMDQPESLIKYVSDRPGQVNRHISSTEKAARLLDWTSKIRLDQGLERTVRWYISNQDRWRNVRRKSLSEPPAWSVRLHRSHHRTHRTHPAHEQDANS